jgi:hypothetical protein
MSRSIVYQLVLKDLYLCRWLIGGSLFAGAISLAMMPLSSVTFYVGSVSFLGVIVILNVMLVMLNIVGERKEKVAHFMLSLPVSTTQYVASKVLANCLAFFVPFMLLLAASVLIIETTAIPDGFVPVAVAVMCYVVLYFSLLLVAALLTDSPAWHTSVIVFGNITINFVIAGLLHDPDVARTTSGPTAVWTASVTLTLIFELALSLVVLALGWHFSTRKKHFV